MAWDGIKDFGFGGKNRTREQDDEYRSRIGGVTRPRVWTKEKCVQELEEILELLKKILKQNEKIEIDNPKKLKQESVRDYNTMMNRILDFMRYLYPPVQQSVNLNVDVKFEDYVDRVKKRLEEKYGIIIVEEKKEEKEIEVELVNE